ncbi:MAG: polysaccharide biosynthesis/export family protein [Verrucomicrobiota bacterium]
MIGLVQITGSGHSQSGYVIRPNDELKITVFQEPDLETTTRVSKSGHIVFPLLGSIKLSGKSVDVAVKEIAEKLNKDYIINPQVTITVLEYAKDRITVLGQVQKPGAIEIPDEGRLDILGAIAIAGGYTSIADPGKITLRRTVKGQEKIFKINGKRLAKDKEAKAFYVLPNDIISVGESLF